MDGLIRRLLLMTSVLVLALACAPTPSALAIDFAFQCTRADSARHDCNVPLSSLATYQGWAHMTGGYCGGAPPSEMMLAAASAPRSAWSWTGRSWRTTSVPAEAHVYIYPFAVDWSWAWTRASGWVAVRDADVIINPWCHPDLPMPAR